MFGALVSVGGSANAFCSTYDPQRQPMPVSIDLARSAPSIKVNFTSPNEFSISLNEKLYTPVFAQGGMRLIGLRDADGKFVPMKGLSNDRSAPDKLAVSDSSPSSMLGCDGGGSIFLGLFGTHLIRNLDSPSYWGSSIIDPLFQQWESRAQKIAQCQDEFNACFKRATDNHEFVAASCGAAGGVIASANPMIGVAATAACVKGSQWARDHAISACWARLASCAAG